MLIFSPCQFLKRFYKHLLYLSVIVLLVLPLLFWFLTYIQPYYFVDEKFHVPQGLKYCKGHFKEWDSKITTLPGLYLISTALWGPFGLCSIESLRLTNFICTYLNIFFTYRIIQLIKQQSITRYKLKNHEDQPNDYSNYLIAWNIALFPPLFFWFFLYYTDVASTATVLAMLWLKLQEKHKIAAIVGVISITIRQTNVIWVAFIGVETCLDVIENTFKDPEATNTLNLMPSVIKMQFYLQKEFQMGIISLILFIFNFCKPLIPYILVLISFLIFVICNGGIVVGDKSAHVPAIHIMQLLYYSIFAVFFSWPYCISYIRDYINFTCNNKITTLYLLGIIASIVHYNTLVHPYLLADNRHFTFYLWKNIINCNYYSKYLLIPLYAFSIFCIFRCIEHVRLWSRLMYLVLISVLLVPQLLLEPRYFILPYIFFRIMQTRVESWQLVAETITTILISCFQFFIFYYKEFSWIDEDHPQRIGW